MMQQRRSTMCGALALSATLLSTGVLRAQGEAPPAADPPPPAAAEQPAPPAAAPVEPPAAAPAEPPTTAAFPPVAGPPPAPPPAAPAPAPGKLGGNPKLKRLQNRNQPDAAPAAAPALTPGVAVAAPVGGPGDAPGAYPGGAAGPARDQSAAASTEGADDEKRPGPFGVMFDVGVPDGIMLSGAYKPIKWARANLGLGYNGVSPGLRIGGALVPFGTGPFFSLDLGHYFGGDANGLVRTFAGDHDSSVVLEDVGYDYMNLRIGAEIGGDRFKFIVRGGFTFIRSTIHHLDTLINEEADPSSTTTVTVGEDPTLTGVAPSLDLGLCVYL
jgi:hypothetical protein